MKTTIVILALLGAGSFLVAYNYKSPPTIEISVLRDITDKHLSQPDTEGIMSLYDLSGDAKWNGRRFNFSEVSDVSYNKFSKLKIEASSKWLSNELERDKEIEAFQNQVSQILSDAKRDSIGKRNSSIYIPIARELNRLSQSKAQKRILVVHSDLMENDPYVSLYDKKRFYLLTSDPDSLKRLFEKWEPLPSLIGIEVYFIYQPSDTEADKQFRVVSGFYRKLLEGKGATVRIEANL